MQNKSLHDRGHVIQTSGIIFADAPAPLLVPTPGCVSTMSEASAALRTRSTRPKIPSFTDRLLLVRLEDEANLDPSLVAYLRAQEAAAEAEAVTRLLNKVCHMYFRTQDRNFWQSCSVHSGCARLALFVQFWNGPDPGL